jgi:hypothetical protein
MGRTGVSGEKTITLMTAWDEPQRPAERPLAERRAKSVGGLGNEGMIFCPVIATVPVTQLDLIGWFCVRCWCSSSSGVGGGRCDSAGREFAQFICLTAFIFWRARSTNQQKTPAAFSLVCNSAESIRAERPQQQWICFSFLTQLTLFITRREPPTHQPTGQKYPFCVECVYVEASHRRN